jgi:hypothetical protein
MIPGVISREQRSDLARQTFGRRVLNNQPAPAHGASVTEAQSSNGAVVILFMLTWAMAMALLAARI